jgi:hypothetical protein
MFTNYTAIWGPQDTEDVCGLKGYDTVWACRWNTVHKSSAPQMEAVCSSKIMVQPTSPHGVTTQQTTTDIYHTLHV